MNSNLTLSTYHGKYDYSTINTIKRQDDWWRLWRPCQMAWLGYYDSASRLCAPQHIERGIPGHFSLHRSLDRDAGRMS